ncbi:nuclear transport factor 2 family protein [Dyadobacter chenhuakuii]|jgi:ketosteroid isomerase-like protein|uniref:Nuclear transport factor 2 family protein n=1 Tax=Dyadobacter chenhuakuii TaxID=2909339 RepID=A0ABY4XLB7_9BACT|nr:nuclear transport factor 2 family protein [Dyadobacter chenhuakuii]MCF2494116.1 nuclear transport factor 2 family protein [Dyadobacter chenhuakuii]USJ31244.1 nuclear transport factor 2 family protein [Dyadobacter chenhuakuii]
MKLPENIQGFIKAQNNQDSTAFANYFTEHATVSDEGSSYSGREEIEGWIEEATEKYNMQLTPIDFSQTGSKGKLTLEVSGTFPGSPLVMNYHLELDGSSISSLKITD